MNVVVLTGRLTTKPELRYTASNIPFTRFSLAVDRPYTSQGQKETDFINIIAWRKQAENVCNFLNKGSLVGINGRIQTGSYDDRDGNKRYTTDVIADAVQFLESKSQSQNKNSEVSPYDYQSSMSQPQQPVYNEVDIDSDPFADFGDSVSIDDDFLE